jgi:hypothetical protein
MNSTWRTFSAITGQCLVVLVVLQVLAAQSAGGTVDFDPYGPAPFGSRVREAVDWINDDNIVETLSRESGGDGILCTGQGFCGPDGSYVPPTVYHPLQAADRRGNRQSWGFAGATGHVHAFAESTGSGGGLAISQSDFYDTYTVTSSVLSPGTPVNVAIEWYFSGHLSSPGVDPSPVTSQAFYRIHLRDGPVFLQLLQVGGQSHPLNDVFFSETGTIDLDMEVGESFRLLSDVDVHLVGPPNVSVGGNRTMSANFSDSGSFTVGSTTPGVSIVSAAHQALVPEPSMLWLLAAGLTALGALGWRQGRTLN